MKANSNRPMSVDRSFRRRFAQSRRRTLLSARQVRARVMRFEWLERRELLSLSLDLSQSSDTGVSDSDRITRDTRPTFEVTTQDPGVLTLDFTGDGIPEVTEHLADIGTREFVPEGFFADGVHTITAEFTPDGGTAPEQASVQITVDTLGPSLLRGTMVAAAPATQCSLVFDESLDASSIDTSRPCETEPRNWT